VAGAIYGETSCRTARRSSSHLPTHSYLTSLLLFWHQGINLGPSYHYDRSLESRREKPSPILSRPYCAQKLQRQGPGTTTSNDGRNRKLRRPLSPVRDVEENALLVDGDTGALGALRGLQDLTQEYCEMQRLFQR